MEGFAAENLVSRKSNEDVERPWVKRSEIKKDFELI